MTAKVTTKPPKNPKQESPRKDQDKQLDRELTDSFPASDPPSVTQPGVKSGAPERKRRKAKARVPRV